MEIIIVLLVVLVVIVATPVEKRAGVLKGAVFAWLVVSVLGVVAVMAFIEWDKSQQRRRAAPTIEPAPPQATASVDAPRQATPRATPDPRAVAAEIERKYGVGR